MRTSWIIMFSILVACHLCISAEEPADTVKVLEKATDILVTRTGTQTSVSASIEDDRGGMQRFTYEVDVVPNDSVAEIEIDDKWGIMYPFSFKKKDPQPQVKTRVKRNLLALNHIYGGWRFNFHDKLHVKNCFEMGVRNALAVSWSIGKRNPSSFSIGIGVGWQRYLSKDGFVYGKDGDRLVFVPVKDGTRVEKSWMDMRTFQIPVLYKQQFANHFNFTLGAVINLNTYCSAVTEVYEGDVKYKFNYKGFQQNLFTADLFAAVNSIAEIGIYFTWSPMNAFKKSYGPELRAWSIGIDLMPF